MRYERRGLFLAVGGVYLDEGRDGEGDEAAEHDPPEEMEVAQVVCHPAGNHAWNHHAQGLHGGADAEDGGAALTLREIDEVEHVGGEAEAVAELFDEDTEVDDEQGGMIRRGPWNHRRPAIIAT